MDGAKQAPPAEDKPRSPLTPATPVTPVMAAAPPTPVTPNTMPNIESSSYEVIPHRVFVGGFPPETDETELREVFEPFGDVREVKIVRNPVTGAPKGYGFVTFALEEEARKARASTQGVRLNGRQLNLGPAMRRMRRPAPVAYVPTPYGYGPPMGGWAGQWGPMWPGYYPPYSPYTPTSTSGGTPGGRMAWSPPLHGYSGFGHCGYGGGQSAYGNGQMSYGGGQPTYGGGQVTYGNGEVTVGQLQEKMRALTYPDTKGDY